MEFKPHLFSCMLWVSVQPLSASPQHLLRHVHLSQDHSSEKGPRRGSPSTRPGQKIPPQGCSTSLGAIRMGWLFLSWTYTHTSIFWLHKTMFCYGHVWIGRLTLRWRPLGSCQTSLVVFHLAPVSIIFLHNIALKGKILLLKMMFVSFCCFTRNSGARGTWNKGVFVGGKT